MSLQQHEHSLARVADVLRNDNPAALLIGAGCSVSAGIPSGNGFARIIRNRYNSVDADGYADCMDELPKPQQKDLIQEKISEADVNWAHVAIAQLIDHAFVDRVLTTNFDPLVSRACALIGRFPAIYDYAAAPGTFNPGTVSDPSVFHLHGQGTGFVLKNSQSEMRELEEALPELLEDTLQDRPLVVVGYGGGDPVFRKLVEHGHFQHELYWITYERSDPADHVETELLDGCENTYFARSRDADEFFIELTRELECFPPTYVEKPFSHQLELLDSLTEFPSLGGETSEGDGSGMESNSASSEVTSPSLEDESGDDIMQDAEEMIQEAVSRFEEGLQATANRARKLLAQGRHDEIEEMWDACETDKERDALRQQYAASLYQKAQVEHVRLRESPDHDSLKEFHEVAETYERVVEISPSYTQALRNLGNLCIDMVRTHADNPEELFDRAIDHYSDAVAEGDHYAFSGWGFVLNEKAGLSTGVKAVMLYDEAIDKLQRAFDNNPDDHVILNNWGYALKQKGKLSSGNDAIDLLDQAIDKYRQALDINPEYSLSHRSWGDALEEKAKLASDDDAIDLLDQAIDKYRQALDINPDDHASLNDWGYALHEKAKLASDDDAIDLLDQAIDKYRQALDIKSDKPVTLNNWGYALRAKAEHTDDGNEAERLREEAEQKFEEAEQIQDDHEASVP